MGGKGTVNIDKWIMSYKVRAFQWIDGKRIYFGLEELGVVLE
jgi:hypothetical protein